MLSVAKLEWPSCPGQPGDTLYANSDSEDYSQALPLKEVLSISLQRLIYKAGLREQPT